MKIRTDLSNIQTMMRDSMEEVLISFPYYSKRFTRLFRKILNCSHERIGTCGREELVKELISCNTPKYTLVVFDMFRVFCKCKFDCFISEMRNREMRDPESYKI